MNFKLREIRTERGLTQDQLADLSGVSKAFLSQIETGARQPSTATLRQIAIALDIPEASLIAPAPGFAEPPPPETMARRVLTNLDKPTATPEPDFKLGTDGKQVQIIATVDRDGLDRLIRQLQLMQQFLNI